ncbi:MAG: alpha/beta hydrolase [Deltaproteobacteria bacterium]|nr:alpha/beta hydrolase [Deltaproteobacteria bacterium]
MLRFSQGRPVCAVPIAAFAPLFALGLAWPTDGRAAPTADLPAGVSETMVFEPVFQGRTRILTAGNPSAEPVVLVHGIGEAGARDWYGVLPGLAQRYRVVAFDLPGFAGSDHRNQTFTPLMYATFIQFVVRERVRGPFTLVGHSLGGAVALRYASVWPADVKRLVVVDAAGILYRSALAKEVLQLGGAGKPAINIWQRSAKAIAGKLVDQFGRVPLDLDAIWGAQTARRIWLGSNSAKIAALALIDEDFSRLLDRVTVPTALIWGTADHVAPPRTARLLAARLPDAALTWLDKVGHEPMHQAPERFLPLLQAAIAGHGFARWKAVPPATSTRDGVCKREEGKVFTGAWRRIDANDCERMRIEHATVQELVANDSEITLEDVRFDSPGVARRIQDSLVTATALVVRAAIAFDLDQAQLDLAGADVEATVMGTRVDDDSVGVFSACRWYTPQRQGGLHGVFKLETESAY